MAPCHRNHGSHFTGIAALFHWNIQRGLKERGGARANKELQFLMYSSPEGNIFVNAIIKNETIWLTQKAIAKLFSYIPDNISLYLKNIYTEGEFNEASTTEEFSVAR